MSNSQPSNEFAQASASPPPIPPETPQPPPLRQAQRPPAKRSSTGRIVLLIIGGAVLLGSLAMNTMFLMELDLAVGPRAMTTTTVKPGSGSQVVALYDVAGIISYQAAARFEQFRNAVISDDDVKAVVLRVESPGGTVTASDQICRMVKDLKGAGKKVVVSMGSLAASGGYYISAPADEIYAEATTVTGSIGVLSGWVVLKGTLDKIGAEVVIIKSTHSAGWKDEMSSFSRPHDYQLAHIRDVLDKMQQRFEKVVKDGRGGRLKTRKVSYDIPSDEEGKPPRRHEEIEPMNGKIYLADEAKSLGLIDAVGYQKDAIDRAAQLAGLSRPKVVRYARRKTFMETLLEGKSSPSLKLDAELLDRLQTPRFMMIWKAQ